MMGHNNDARFACIRKFDFCLFLNTIRKSFVADFVISRVNIFFDSDAERRTINDRTMWVDTLLHPDLYVPIPDLFGGDDMILFVGNISKNGCVEIWPFNRDRNVHICSDDSIVVGELISLLFDAAHEHCFCDVE